MECALRKPSTDRWLGTALAFQPAGTTFGGETGEGGAQEVAEVFSQSTRFTLGSTSVMFLTKLGVHWKKKDIHRKRKKKRHEPTGTRKRKMVDSPSYRLSRTGWRLSGGWGEGKKCPEKRGKR